MPATTTTLKKILPAGLRPRDGQRKCQMAVYVLRNPAFFKAELAIANTWRDGEDVTQHHTTAV